jgi:VWFA-related protein
MLPLFWAVSSAGASGDPPEFTYRAHTNEVRVSFSAVDQNDHGVATLQAGDLAVVDGGFVVRDFQSFSRSDWTKLEIAILIDSSESVSPGFPKEIADSLGVIERTRGVPAGNISMFSFHGAEPTMICAGTCRTAFASERFPARAGGLTPLFDTIVFAEDYLSHRGDAQTARVLIVFSDGADTISRASLHDAIASAAAADIQIYCISLAGLDGHSPGAAALSGLAHATGARCFPASSGATRALDAILEGFHANYTVSYRLPSQLQGFHSVQIVPTHNLNLHFRNRSGYYYPQLHSVN